MTDRTQRRHTRGRFFHVELEAMFITAVLTVIGFSVHDTEGSVSCRIGRLL
jgi:hypothetical protein